ncbi:MAG: TonB-dependent receptor [Planctomycetota bacterium]|nr:TonB-dependent receptor [Planctomycetota bacterium]
MLWALLVFLTPTFITAQTSQPPGSIRGVVSDGDFDLPLAGAAVVVVETGASVRTGDQGNFLIEQVAPGSYTLVFSKDGYERVVRSDVVVQSGRLTDVDAVLTGEFTDMDEFLVQDILQLGAGSEGSLLRLRFESSTILDSIGSDLMSRAGASDAASGLRLVAGASVSNGKFAVIRGLPDRYVSSQMNGVRLPSADEDKRAVELDQFPSAVIESIQVSKTFTPDQQGDASGGAVNVRLKGIPDETSFQIKGQIGSDTESFGNSSFLEFDSGPRRIQTENLGSNWEGTFAPERTDAPIDHKFAVSGGGKHVFDNGVKVGGFVSLFYERDSSFRDDGRDDSLWVETPGAQLTPQAFQGSPTDGDFKTSLFDVTRASQSLRWGGLGTFGVETENHRVGLTYLFTRSEEDTATVATDTRGKAYFIDLNDPSSAPFLRTDTLEHSERATHTLQLGGRHVLPFEGFSIGNKVKFKKPEFDWSVAESSALLDQPDKRQFGALWRASPTGTDGLWLPYKPAANFTIGNAQRIFKRIDEDSEQYALNLKLPFEQWSETEGYVKLGVFRDKVDRKFNQDTFSNFGDTGPTQTSEFDDPWSVGFSSQVHPITSSNSDVDYTGQQEISASYGMFELPLTPNFRVLAGARMESIDIGIQNIAEGDAEWYPPGTSVGIDLQPGDADVAFSQDDLLPAVGLTYTAGKVVTIRASYSETVAHQTFKELTPIIQQEFLGGPIFIGNPFLQMSALQNYDVRVDYAPYEGSLISASAFLKHVEDPIEYVQRGASFNFNTAVNYPKGSLKGIELEVRQNLGRFNSGLDGLAVGANGTLIDSEVTLPDNEAAVFASNILQVPFTTRDMTDAPEHLYNFYVTYDIESTKTQFALFYTVQGDTLVAGAANVANNFVPSVYAKEYGTLNFSLSQGLSEHVKLQIQAKNLTNPDIEEVYRSSYIGDDVTKTSYSKGLEFTLGLTISF